MVYSIANSDILQFDDFFILNKNNTRKLHNFKLVVPKSTYDVRKYDFSNRVINVWNALPENIVTSQTSKQFMTGLKKIDLSGYLRGPL